MLALAIIWNIQPAASTSSNYITSSVIPDTQLVKTKPSSKLYELVTEIYFQFLWSKKGQADPDVKKPKTTQKHNVFIKIS